MVTLTQSLIIEMENEAKWLMKNRYIKDKKAPNYLDYIYLKALKSIKPKAIKIID